MTTTEIRIGSHLFCTAAMELIPGTLLKPGNFRQRLLDRIVIQVQAHPRRVTVPDPARTGSSLLELAWETVRLREFPHRPSRLDCLFLWRKEETARDFHSRRPWPTELYEVEIVQCARVFAANMGLISYFEDSETMASMFERARRYWRTESTDEDGEVLMEGTAQIVRVLCAKPA